MESLISNACYAIGDGDGCKRGAITESIISNTPYAIGDSGSLTPCNKRIGSRLNDCIAILSAIIGCITAFDYHRCKRRTIVERKISNTCYAIRDGNGGEGGATSKSTIFNSRYAVRNSNGGE